MNSPVIESDQQVSELTRFTINDVHVGSRLYEVLVDHAKNRPRTSIFYSDLLSMAKDSCADAEIQNAVPIGIGPKLFFVAAFCAKNGYPNLACLAVNKSTGKPGAAFKGDWVQEMSQVAAFDWSVAKPHLETFAAAVRKAITKRKPVKEGDALNIVWDFYSQNRMQYPTYTPDDKCEIVKQVMQGVSVDTAFQYILGR